MWIVYVTAVFLTLTVTKIVVGREESEITNETLVLLVLGLEVVSTWCQMGVLGCLVWAVDLAHVALPSLVHCLVEYLANLLRLLISHSLGYVLLHGERSNLDGRSGARVDRRICDRRICRLWGRTRSVIAPQGG